MAYTFTRLWLYLLEPTTEAGRRTPASVLRERLLFGLSFLFGALMIAVYLPGGHPFSVVAPVGLVLLGLSMRFNVQRTATSWTSCEQGAFVLVAFALPLNLLPLAMLVCGLAVQPRRPKPVLTLLVTACNSWSGISAALLLSMLAPGRASWEHWPAYVIAFSGQIILSLLVFAVRDWMKGQLLPLEDAISALATDACLTPIGLAAAVQSRSSPVAGLALMLGTTALLALTSHEHGQRIIQTERALRDPLTGLANRALFSEAGAACASRCERSSQHAALLLIDLDDFKQVNDTFGHQGGDDVLVALADRVRASTRAVDLSARVGGDEFAVILAEPMELGDAQRVAENLRAQLRQPIELSSGQTIEVSASIGLALFGPDIPLEAATGQADAALYEEKLRAHGEPAGRSPRKN